MKTHFTHYIPLYSSFAMSAYLTFFYPYPTFFQSLMDLKWLVNHYDSVVSSSSDIFRARNFVPHFGQMLENIFMPIFEATINPQSNPELSIFLQNVSDSTRAIHNLKSFIHTVYK